jgi:transportin-3
MDIASTESVLHNIYVLYNNPDKVEKEKASKWLEEFQKSVSIGTLSQ